jgi:hypothetical protein
MLVALHCSNAIWDYIMSKFFQRQQDANALNTPYPPNILQMLNTAEEEATHLVAIASSRHEVKVTDPEFGSQFLVQFSPSWKCTCGDFQDFLLPCKHAWRAITVLQGRHYDYVASYYSTQSLRDTYKNSLPALLKDDLIPNQNCGPPVSRRQRGRPTDKVRMRFQEEDPVHYPNKCGICRVRGHNRKNCPQRIERHIRRSDLKRTEQQRVLEEDLGVTLEELVTTSDDTSAEIDESESENE